MKRFLRALRLSGLLLLVALLTTSCFFGSSLEVTILEFEGDTTVFISTNASSSICNNDEAPYLFECVYFPGDGEEDPFSSRITMSGYELALYLILLDPLILQVPAEASDFKGSYSQPTTNSGGDLVITAGQSSVRADATKTMQAEAGMQLVIVDLPKDAPTSGNTSYHINFKIPSDLPSLDVKALFTGKVEVTDATFYMPLLPCTTDISSLPTISIPMPNGGVVGLPISGAQGCDNVTYTLVQEIFATKMRLPLLGK